MDRFTNNMSWRDLIEALHALGLELQSLEYLQSIFRPDVAITAKEFESAKSVTLTGDVTGTASSKAGWTIATTLKNSGVKAGKVGSYLDAEPYYSARFTIPNFTVDAKGRVTEVRETYVAMPPEIHDATKMVVGSSSSKAHAATTNGNTFINIFDTHTYQDGTIEDQARSSVGISGSGATSVASTAAGSIVISSTDTNTMMIQNVSSANNTYPILLVGTANATGNLGAKTAIFGSGVKVNPSKSAISATTFIGELEGNAATATILQTTRTINGTDFNGSANITTATWGTARNITIKDADNTNAGVTVSVNGSKAYIFNLPSTIKASLTGNASTATTLQTKRKINDTEFDGSAAITTAKWGTARNIYISDADATNTGAAVGVSGAANATLKLPATIKATLSGNAATATKFASAQKVELTGDVLGSVTSQAGWSIATTLKNSGVTAGNYGPSANASPAYGKTFSVPYITVDAAGRVTAASTKTITMPADSHWTTKAVLGASGSDVNAATTNGNTYFSIFDDTASRASFNIVGDGATTVASDANGKLTIRSTDTNTMMTQSVSTANNNYPILLVTSANATTNLGAKTAIFSSGVKVNPSTSTITATTVNAALTSLPKGTSWVTGVTQGQALVNATTTGYGTIWNAPTKNYRVGCSTYPSNNDTVYICYSVTNANVTAGTNTTAQSLTWDANTGTLNASGGFGGNAATATQFSANKSVTLTGDVTGTVASKAGWSVTTTLANTSVTAGSYGPSANATPGYGATFNVPYFTVDSKGRLTAASTKTVKIPADSHWTTKAIIGASDSNTNAATTSGNTFLKIFDDTNVRASFNIIGSGATIVTSTADGTLKISSDNNLMTQSVSTANNTYPILLVTAANATTNRGASTAIFGSGVKVNPSTSTVIATTFQGALSGNAATASQAYLLRPSNIGNGAYTDALVVSASDKSTSGSANRVSTIRVTNGDGFNEILLGVHNEANAAPGGISLRNTNGTYTVSLPGTTTGTFSGNLTGNVTGSLTVPAGGKITVPSGATLSGNLSGNASSSTKLATARSLWGNNFDGTTNLTSTITVSGNANQFIASHGSYHFLIRNDGSNTCFLMSAKDGAAGTWSSARPLTITNSTGVCNINGNAATATKLATARTLSLGSKDFVGSASFDGSGNVSLNAVMDYCIVSVGNTNNYPFHRIAYTAVETGNYVDRTLILLVHKAYINGGYGIVKICLRTNNASGGSVANAEAIWLVRSADLPADCIQLGFINTAAKSVIDVFYKSGGGYHSAQIRALAHGSDRSNGIGSHGFTLISSTEVSNTTTTDPKTSTECWATIAKAATALNRSAYTSTIIASDAGIVNNATLWNGYTNDIGTENNTDTWIPVLNGTKLQHTVRTNMTVGYANKLATKRSLWGNDFDGSANVTGQIKATSGVNLYKSNLYMTVNKGSANTTDYAIDVLKALGDNAGYGINLALCGSGNTIVGGGEAGNAQLNDLKDNSGENLYLVADGSIYLKVNGNTWANAKTVTLDTSAQLSGLAKVTATTFVGALTGNVTGSLTVPAGGSITVPSGATLSGNLSGNASSSTKLATARSLWGNNFDGTTNLTSTITVSGNANQFIASHGSYHFLIRNDGSNTFFMMSAKDGTPGTWSSARPLTITNSTGIANINGNAATATTATKLGTATVGGTAKPIYLNSGAAAAISATVGNTSLPVYLNAGTITACGTGFTTSHSNLTKGTKPGKTVWTRSWIAYDSGGTAVANRLQEYRSFIDANGKSGAELLAYDYTSESSTSCILGIYKELGGVSYAQAPTPADNDNTTKIATTAWVQKYCNTTKAFLTPYTNVTELGRYLDFHYDNANTYNYDVRMQASSQGTAAGGGILTITAASVNATKFIGAFQGDVTGNCSGSSGSCTGNAANVTGVVAIANGGTGATTRLNAIKALTNEDVSTNAQYFLTITSSWGKAGYTSVANAKTVLGLKSAAYTASTDYATASHTHSYLPLSGGTVTGALVLSRPTDVGGTKDAVGALSIGDIAGTHLAFDDNEIMAKASATTVSTLNLNTDGGLVKIGNGGLQVNGQVTINRDNSSFGGGLKLTGAGQNFALNITRTDFTKGTAPSSGTKNWGIDFYGNGATQYKNRVGMLECIVDANNLVTLQLAAFGCSSATNTSASTLKLFIDKDGNATTSVSTPAADSNTTHIATTKWVRSYVAPTNKAATLSWGESVTVATVGGTNITAKLPANPNTDTHWTSHLYAGASNGNANAATTNGNTYLIICDNTTARDRRLIKGTGATTVTSDTKGVITINSTDTNTTYSAGTGLTLSGTQFSVKADTYAAANHTHSGYAASNHTHSGYASSSHTHDSLSSSGNHITITTTKNDKAAYAFFKTGVAESSTMGRVDCDWAFCGSNGTVGTDGATNHKFGGFHVYANGKVRRCKLLIKAPDTATTQYGYNAEISDSGSFNCILECGSKTGSMFPQTTNKMSLGNSSCVWTQVYATKTSISTSDERKKSSIQSVPDEILNAWKDVVWYQYQFNNAIEQKGIDKARLHVGIIAQRVDKVFKDHGLDISRHSFFCYDKWDESVDVESGKVSPAGDAYAIRYEEALCIEAAYQRRRADRAEARITALEEENKDLKDRLSKLEAIVATLVNQ